MVPGPHDVLILLSTPLHLILTTASIIMPVYCITGANRGIGLEIVRQLAQLDEPSTFFALTRTLDNDLSDLDAAAAVPGRNNTLHILECDTGSIASIQAFADQAARILSPTSQKIDYLINNAGINLSPLSTSLALVPEDIHAMIQVNLLGPAKIVEFLLKAQLLVNDAKIMHISSGLGSNAYTKAWPYARHSTGYSMSKAALNVLTLHQSEELHTVAKLTDAVVVSVCPGWTKTRMGGDGALVEVEDSVAGIIKVLRGLGPEDNGRFYEYSGRELPW